jgi:bacterioferritin-associated ferredoxin
MVVCVCNRYRDSEIRAAARSGMKCPREIYSALGQPPRCGRCLEFAAEVIADEAGLVTPVPIDALAGTAS